MLITTLTAVTGRTTASKEGQILDQASTRISSSLSSISTARATDIPTFEPNMPAPSIRAGAGGEGAKKDVAYDSDNVSEQVGETIEKNQQSTKTAIGEEEGGTVLRERAEDERPNPKKRMWEEPTENSAASSRPKDEL